MMLCNSHFVSGQVGTHTSVVQWEQPVGHIRGKQIGQYTLVETHKTGKQLEQQQQQPPQQQEYSHNHWLHKPGLTGSSYEW